MDRPVESILDRLTCIRLLSSARIGRVVFTDSALPAIDTVRFRVVSNAVVFDMPSGSVRPSKIADTVVAFYADEIDLGTQHGWSVTVHGRAVRAPASTPGADPLILVPLDRVTGRRTGPAPLVEN